MPSERRLASDPDWMISGCTDLPPGEQRLRLLEAVCDGMGDALYPGFLNLLVSVGRLGDHDARRAVADTLIEALRSGRLPSGRRGSYGRGKVSGGFGAFGQTRALGPIEYLCAWHAQPSDGASVGEGDDAAQPLDAAAFMLAASSVVELVNASEGARRLYVERLLAEADDPIEGALPRAARSALHDFAQSWSQTSDATVPPRRYVDALPSGDSRGGGALRSLAGLR